MSKQPREQVEPAAPAPVVADVPKCKILQDMRQNPAADWNLEDVATLCRQVGMTLKPPKRGTHHKVISGKVARILTIPARKPIKVPYIRLLVSMADQHLKHSGA